MDKHLHRIAGVGAAALALGLAAAPVAGAAGTADKPRDPAKVKQACEHAIDKRVATLHELQGRVDGATALDDATRATLTTQISTSSKGLTDLKATVDAASTPEALKDACTSQFTDFRVYALVVPRTRLVIATAKVDAAADKAGTVDPRIHTAIDRAAQRGIPAEKIDAAKASDADFEARLAKAHEDVSGLSDQLLALTPAQWNSGEAKPVLQQARDEVKAAVGELKGARQDVKAIRTDLRKAR